MDVKLPYGIREGHIVLISEIDPTEKGEKCNCTCPLCGSILLAKIGDIRQPHFAHKSSNNCNDSDAQETGLHRLAKEIIHENHKILVPGFVITRQEVIPDGSDPFVAAAVNIELPHMNSRQVEYDSVEIEKPIDDIVADAVIKVGEKSCIIEVAVTHFVDEAKEKKLEEIGRSAFEIDLSDLLNSFPTRDDVVTAVLSNESNRYWVCNPLREQRLIEKKKEYQKKYDVAVLKREQEEEQKLLDDARKLKIRQINIRALQELMEPENYVSELRRLRNDAQAAQKLKWFDFSRGKGLLEYPFYMDIPITGECVFSCDRRIWQGKLFDDYVYKGFNQELCIFYVHQIRNWIFKGKSMIQYDSKKTYRAPLIINGQAKEVSFSYDVIWRYFEYLELLGFVWHVHSRWHSERPQSLEPPDYQTASILNDILRSVDQSAPNVDQLIKSELLSRLSGKAKNLVLEWD